MRPRDLLCCASEHGTKRRGLGATWPAAQEHGRGSAPAGAPAARSGARRPRSVAATAGVRMGMRAAEGAPRDVGERHFAGTPTRACTPVAQVRRTIASRWAKSAGETRALRFFENAANSDQGGSVAATAGVRMGMRAARSVDAG